MYHLEILGIKTHDFNIANYEQESENTNKYGEMVDEFIKKYLNYSIWW